MRRDYRQLKGMINKKKLIELTDECIRHWLDNVKRAEEEETLDLSSGSCSLCSYFSDCWTVEGVCPLYAIGEGCVDKDVSMEKASIYRILEENQYYDEYEKLTNREVIFYCKEMVKVLKNIKKYLKKYDKEETKKK